MNIMWIEKKKRLGKGDIITTQAISFWMNEGI